MKYGIVYLWQSKRHRHLGDFTSLAAANAVVAEYRAKKFHAWVEEICNLGKW